jgi:L-iditol 2-dehydrogenase
MSAVDKAVVQPTKAIVPDSSQTIPVVPALMQAMVLTRPGELSVETVPVPTIGPGDVLIKVECATTCGTDLKAFKRGHPQIPMPGLFGHEYAGIVVSAGEGAKFKVGDAVLGVHSAPCGVCFWCGEGQENLCESIMETKVLGSFAQYLAVPKRIVEKNMFIKPAHISFEIGSLLEPLSCVAQAVRELQPVMKKPAELDVLVVGPGAIGLLFVTALKACGVTNITLAGRNKKRLAVGEQLGAKTVSVNDFPKPEGRGHDIVIECTGQVEIWQRSIDYVRRGGSLMLFGGCPAGTTVQYDTKRVHYDQISILSPFHFGTDAVKQAYTWLGERSEDLALLLSGDRTLADGATIFHDLDEGRGIKYVIRP